MVAAAPIEWEAPARCPSTTVVYDRLREALGHEVSELGSVSRVRGVIVAEAVGYRLTLEVVDAGRRSSRTFRAERCEDLAGAAALAIALVVHPAADARDGGMGAEVRGPAEEVPIASRAERAPTSRSPWPPSMPATTDGRGAFLDFERRHPVDARCDDVIFLRAVARAPRGDAAGASTIAREYLERYPSGLRVHAAKQLITPSAEQD